MTPIARTLPPQSQVEGLPGARLRGFALGWLGPETVASVIDPALADLHAEWLESQGLGRLRVLVSGYTALCCSLVVVAGPRAVVPLALSALITLELFALMAYLIRAEDPGPIQEIPHVRIEMIRVPRLEAVKPKERIPERPKPPPPEGRRERIAFNRPEPIPLPEDGIQHTHEFDSRGPAMDTPATPLVRYEPSYPPGAMRRGIEGWVLVSLDLNTAGAVETVRVLDSSPPGVFDRAARRAVQRWRYQPAIVDGRPVPQSGIETVLVFELED